MNSLVFVFIFTGIFTGVWDIFFCYRLWSFCLTPSFNAGAVPSVRAWMSSTLYRGLPSTRKRMAWSSPAVVMRQRVALLIRKQAAASLIVKSLGSLFSSGCIKLLGCLQTAKIFSLSGGVRLASASSKAATALYTFMFI